MENTMDFVAIYRENGSENKKKCSWTYKAIEGNLVEKHSSIETDLKSGGIASETIVRTFREIENG